MATAMASSTQQATDLSTAQDEAEYPLAAQIPLSSFTLPTFPEQASKLRSLTLTSDINLNDYQTKHLAPGTFEPCTTLPKSLTHLTLELFSLGFPAPFLTEIGKSLPSLQSLTLFSCLVDGLEERSRRDALTFFQNAAKTLKEIHIVDSFARAGFWKEVGKTLSTTSDSGPAIVEVSYTYRGHYESDFLNRVSGEEWAEFISPSVIGLSLNFTSPPPDLDTELKMQTEKPEDAEFLQAQDGILPFASDGRASLAVRRKIEQISGHKKEGAGLNLKVLNLSMFSLRPVEVGEIAYAVAAGDGSGGLIGLTVSMLLEKDWFEILLKGLSEKGAGSAIESLEIVGVPIESGDGAEDAEKLLMKSEEKIKAFNSECSKLERLEMTVLQSRRIGKVIWTKESESWKMQRETSSES
ncbi:hypothetical protein LTR64_003992 [Lithohypha guttulata]|uniref:uncharacterized protein n=1 Tax=Lithohypha guttulata TaxID=1690604 RepID=UPI002DDE9533|nr:hypothetical protein LTR51_006713 [Lithohypha guttulata]